MIRPFTCIICPNGCEMEAQIENGQLVSVTGATCKKGEAYVRQELTDPRRTIASSALVDGGVLPLVSVRLTAPVPKDRLMDVMAEIQKLRLQAPVALGQCLIANVLGLGSDVIATKNIAAR